MLRGVAAIGVATAFACLPACGDDGGGEPDPAAVTTSTASAPRADPFDPRDAVLTERDLPPGPPWARLPSEPPPGDEVDRCVDHARASAQDGPVRDARSLYFAGLQMAASYAFDTASDADARSVLRALERDVVPCVVRTFREMRPAATRLPGVGLDAGEPVPAPTGAYDTPVSGTSFVMELRGPDGAIRFRSDLFVLRHERRLLLVFFFTDPTVTPPQEDDALAAVAGRMGVERLEPLG